MRIVYLGTPEFAVPSLKRLLAEPEIEVAAVVTQPDKRRGRGSQLTPSPVKQVAQAAGVPIWQPRRIKKDAATLEALRATAADAFVVVAYGQILSADILSMPRLGCINAHGSILPKYRGAAPIQWCLYHGETETGITTMQMDAGMDTGPMLLKRKRPIGLLDTAQAVAADLAQISADLLVETLQGLDRGTLTPTPQDDAAATYAPLIEKADFVLDWSRPAIALHNQVRGFYPNCFTTFRGSDLKVSGTVPLGADYWSQLPSDLQPLQASTATLSAAASASAGEMIGILKNWGPVVQTGEGWLLLRSVQPTGKKAQSGWDFANGSRLQVGERLGALESSGG